jgi:hypothetical protein
VPFLNFSRGRIQNPFIVRGNRQLAIAYEVQCRICTITTCFPPRLEQDLRNELMSGKIHSIDEAAEQAEPHGLLPLDGSFQDRYFDPGRSRLSGDYFLA